MDDEYLWGEDARSDEKLPIPSNGIRVPEAGDMYSMALNGIKTEAQYIEPEVYASKHDDYGYYENAHNYYFPQPQTQDCNHISVHDDILRMAGIERRPQEELPRPDFERPLWKHIRVEYDEIMDAKLDMELDHFRVATASVFHKFYEDGGPDVSCLFEYGIPFSQIDPKDCDFMIVRNCETGETFLDIKSYDDNMTLMCVHIEQDLERERDRERYMSEPMTMPDVWKEFMKERDRDDDFDR